MLVYLQMIGSQEEKSKFEVLYRRYRQYLYRVAFGILNNSADAEDALHAAFVKIAENIQKIEDPESNRTKGFLIAVVRNTAIDLYRKKQAHPDAEYIEAISGVQEHYEGDNGVARCIAKLPERQQNLLILRYQYGCTSQETAKILGISPINARQIEYRAKKKLRLLCEKEGILC